MGTGISIDFEYFDKEWKCAEILTPDRNYEIFARLGDVRNSNKEFIPIASNRKLPLDYNGRFSEEIIKEPDNAKYFSYSYCDYDELKLIFQEFNIGIEKHDGDKFKYNYWDYLHYLVDKYHGYGFEVRVVFAFYN